MFVFSLSHLRLYRNKYVCNTNKIKKLIKTDKLKNYIYCPQLFNAHKEIRAYVAWYSIDIMDSNSYIFKKVYTIGNLSKVAFIVIIGGLFVPSLEGFVTVKSWSLE